MEAREGGQALNTFLFMGAYACIIVAMVLIIWDIWDRRRKK